MSDYHYLVAGLPEITFDGSKVNFSIERFKDEVYENLSGSDAAIIDLFFYAWDNANLLSMLRHGTDVDLPRSGCFSREELSSLIASAKEGDARPVQIPAYMYDFLEYYFENEERTDVMFDDILAMHYYVYAEKCSKEFISDWFAFNRNLNNLQVAYTARKHKMNIADYIVGDNDVAEALRTSNARDFGLASSLDYLEAVQRICEIERLEERERQIDELRWKWLDDNSVFHYFSVERLFVFLQKLDIVLRWASLDAESGMARYVELIDALKSGFTINEE